MHHYLIDTCVRMSRVEIGKSTWQVIGDEKSAHVRIKLLVVYDNS